MGICDGFYFESQTLVKQILTIRLPYRCYFQETFGEVRATEIMAQLGLVQQGPAQPAQSGTSRPPQSGAPPRATNQSRFYKCDRFLSPQWYVIR